MNKITDLNWTDIQTLNLSALVSLDYLEGALYTLHQAIVDQQISRCLMDYVLEQAPAKWRVVDEVEHSKVGQSTKRVMELLTLDSQSVLATMTAYQDSHSGQWIELVISSEEKNRLTAALDNFLTAKLLTFSASVHSSQAVH